ncbi:MAG: prepilin-type N-terminal cleavage/methylation domain-containing protein [Acidobacteria bacterium]|nr:prepilin-type N-terminal cleavage/methylation domain-containing protein [Acidobacteriota bacterium]
MRVHRSRSGYSLIELLIVLVIVGVLALFAGSYFFQPRQGPAVQNLLNEIEGIIAESHKVAGSTLGNVRLEGTGSWGDKSLELKFKRVSGLGGDLGKLRADTFRDWSSAGIDASDTGIATAVGSETLASALSATAPDLLNDLTQAMTVNLFAGGGKQIELNAFNKQFMTGFSIPVVGLKDGKAYAGAPAGVIVVSGNRIYKFYKSGSGSAKPWRRL